MLASVGLGSLCLFSLWKGFKSLADKSVQKKVLFHFGLTLVLIVIAINLLMVVNVELIHVFQYCLMAILLYPFFKNLNTVLFFTTLFGALDEAYQYFYLFPEKAGYYDFNDILINMLGACLGIVFLRSQGLKTVKTYGAWYKSPVFISIVLIAALFLIGLFTQFIGIKPDKTDEISGFTLIRRAYAPGFWRQYLPGERFHILRPLEFLIIFPILFLSFSRLGK